MEDFLIVITIIAAIISIIILIKFFQIAKDLKSVNAKLNHIRHIASDVNDIRLGVDRGAYSKNELLFLIANGYKDEAKRMLLRKVWEDKREYTFEKMEQMYGEYFAQIGEPFPDEAIFKKKEKVSNPV